MFAYVKGENPIFNFKLTSMESIVYSLQSHWFEIPVQDFERAATFYAALLNNTVQEAVILNNRMGFFPSTDGKFAGAIVQGEEYHPSANGSLIYLDANPDLSEMLSRVENAGGHILLGKTEIPPDNGFYAVVLDTEGNKIALHSSK